METLILNAKEVHDLLEIHETIDAVENVFNEYGQGKTQMPAKTYLYFPEYEGDLRIMPTYLPLQELAGVKIVNVHPDNKERNLPTVMATISLNDPKTGYPLAILAGTEITAIRTGAAGAVATKYLSREDSETLGLIGAGAQARTQLRAIQKVRNIRKVIVSDVSKQAAEKFALEMGKETGIEIVQAENLQQATQVDILSTITPVREPIIRDEWILPGTHINAIGADAKGKQELDNSLLKRAKVFVDDWEQALHSGEINVPLSKGIIQREDIVGTLGEMMAGKIQGRIDKEQVTVFDSTGLAIQDIATAKIVYEKAVEKGIGKKVSFIDQSA